MERDSEIKSNELQDVADVKELELPRGLFGYMNVVNEDIHIYRDDTTSTNWKNESIKIMQNKSYINVKDIKTLERCSMQQARKYRIEVLSSQYKCYGAKAKVELEKYLEYRNNKALNYLYRSCFDYYM